LQNLNKKEVNKLDYTELSQKVKENIESYLLEKELDFKSESSWGREEKKLINSKEIIWKQNSQKIKLSFPNAPEKGLNRVIVDLEQSLEKIGVELRVKERKINEGQVEAVLEILFKAEEVPSKELLTYRLHLLQPEVKAKMAFILDDLGFHRAGTKEALKINRPITVAVLPFRPYSTQEAKSFKEAGHQVLLHLPMEPVSETNPGAGAIYTDMTEDEIKDQLRKDIADLGIEVAGVNNHMGSKATADERVMKIVLGYLQERGIFFVDSSTAPRSAVPVAAQAVGEQYALNHLFIDNVDQKDSVKKAINKLARIALEKGELITIGHVRTNTVLAIQEMIPELEKMGIQLVYVSELIK
jgi:hypothetical protein